MYVYILSHGNDLKYKSKTDRQWVERKDLIWNLIRVKESLLYNNKHITTALLKATTKENRGSYCCSYMVAMTVICSRKSKEMGEGSNTSVMHFAKVSKEKATKFILIIYLYADPYSRFFMLLPLLPFVS